MRIRNWFWFMPLFAATGCFIETDSGRGVGRGALVVDWTIDGVKDPAQCYQGDADVIDIAVLTPSGAPLGEYQQDCAAFATSIELRAGSYAADAVLLDPTGRDRTTVVQLEPFRIYGGEELVVYVDFPASSFY